MADYSYLLGTSSSSSGISSDMLLVWAQTRNIAQAAAAAKATASTSTVKAPWDDTKNLTPASTLVTNALSGKAFFNANDKSFPDGATDDENKLFALHAGLNSLAALAGRFDQAGVTTAEQARLTTAFDSGMRQLQSYLSGTKFSALTMSQAALATQALSNAKFTANQRTYLTGTIASGDPTTANAAFAGNLAFHIDGKDVNDNAKSIDIDLADMGSTPRSLNSVVEFINSKLRGAGLTTTVAANKLGTSARTGDQYGLKLAIASGETLNFSATTSPAMYLASATGALLKINDPSGGQATPASNAPNVAFSKTIAAGGTVRQSALGADGSVYVLADVAAKSLPGQPIKGDSDVALMKYDTGGNLVYARTLGAASEADGLSLAIADDGKIAIAGSVTGSLSDNVKASATGADSFVTMFDKDGVEQWTVRSKATRDDQYDAVAFGADGTVYVAGRQKTAAGDTDAVFAAYSSTGTLRTTQTFGGAGNEAPQKLITEDLGGGNQRITLASTEAGRLVLRQYNDDGASITAGATRDLGMLGGDVTGLVLDGGDLYLSGDTSIGGLNAGTVARGYSGGQDGFVTKLSSDLTAGAGDRITYLGGAGDDSVAGISVVSGQVYLGGDTTKTFGGVAELTEQDGYVARLDTNGTLAWAQRFASATKFNAATFVADGGGASALDRLGLPQGQIDTMDATDLVSRTSLRVGDEFSISLNGSTPQTIKIAAGDTLQKLADKVERVILSAGVGSVALATAGDGLKIIASGSNKIELRAGPAGKNALDGLGLAEGVVTAATSSTAKNTPKTYGLGLSSTLSLADKSGRMEAVSQIGTALIAVQKAFRDLIAPAATTTPTGTAPAYLKKELANYQAALARLGG